MIAPADGTTLNIDISMSLVAVVTLVTVIVFGMVTLARPSRATVAWGVAFGLGMLATFMWVAADQLGDASVRAVASGFMIAFEPLIWLGLRWHFGRRTPWWPVVAFVIAVPAALGLTVGLPVFQIVFRVAFLAAGVFAGLIAVELLRAKAASQRDQEWSILVVRLDDPVDLREATTGAGFAMLVERFHADIDAVTPAASTVRRVADDYAVVIVHGSTEAVQHHVRGILTRISEIDEDGPLGSMRLSASIGWAAVGERGYDYDVLVEAAAEAAERARSLGGDRWSRARRPR